MPPPFPPRRSWLPSVLALAAALSATHRAAAAELPRPRPAASAAEDLSQGAARPDDFKRVLEGSTEGRGDVEGAVSLGREPGRAPVPALRPDRAEAARPREAVVPAAAIPLARRAEPPARGAWTPDLATQEVAAVLGLGLLLIAGSWLETPRESEPDAAPEPARVAPRFEFRPPETALAPSRRIEAPAAPEHVDTRVPASTWRAISQREQDVIECWNRSPEKSAGAASLPEWLDARGGGGVDVPLLKAKLFRDA